MRVVGSGYVYDARDRAPRHRSSAFSNTVLLADGTILVTFRRGERREGADGHVCVCASVDGGQSWEMRYDGEGRGAWEDGTPGEEKSLLIAELEPGVLTAAGLWVSQTRAPEPWINPATQGLVEMRTYHTTSRDGGRTWSERRWIDLSPHPAASPTGPPFRVADGSLAQPYEHWKEYDDASPGRPRALVRHSLDEGRTWPSWSLVAANVTNRLYYWDQRMTTQPTSGRIVAMFWTHDSAAGRDRDCHITWGSPDARDWDEPIETPLSGQHCQPIALGGERLAAAYSHRRDPPGVRVALSEDFGRTWDRSREVAIYDSREGTEPGAAGSREIADYWVDMEAWRFGHPRGFLLPGGEIFVVYYAGDARTKSIRWARVDPGS